MECFVSSILLEIRCFALCFLVAVGFIHSFLYHIMESFSLDSLIDPELQEKMEDLLESVYGEEYLSQQSHISVAAQVRDEDDSDKFNEASSCDPDPKSLAREFIESRNCEEENEHEGSGEG